MFTNNNAVVSEANLNLIEAVKVVPEVVSSNPARYEIKVPNEVVDGYGTKFTMFNKEVVSKEELLSQRANLIAQQESMNADYTARIATVDAKLAQVALA